MPLFDTYIAVDWSAANAPGRGADSIWIATARRRGKSIKRETPRNPATRSAAMGLLMSDLEITLATGRRTLVGFDFPFGYPSGAAAILTGEASWTGLWDMLAERVIDAEDNRSNRFELAALLNRDAFGEAVYWGRPHTLSLEGLPARRSETGALHERLQFRLAERAAPPAKSVWQLAYAGSVGSQAMLGVARLAHMKRALGGACAIWPFETGFASKLAAPIVVAEIYPTLFNVDPRPDEPKDSAQVRAVVSAMATADAGDRLAGWLSAPEDMTPSDQARVVSEEGWILGVGTGAFPCAEAAA